MATCKASAAPNLTEPEAEAEPRHSAGPVGPVGHTRKVSGGIYGGYKL
jgi:hypothetical protein